MPWWSSWNTACWASVPVPPQVTGALGRVERLAVRGHRLAVRFHLELLEIGRQQPQPLVISEDRARLAPQLLDIEPVGEGGEQRRIGAPARRSGNGGPSPPRLRAIPRTRPSRAPAPPRSRPRSTANSARRRPRANGRMRVSSIPASTARFGRGGDRDHPAVRDPRPRAARSQSSAAAMLASVSVVVKVLDATTTSVVAGSSAATASSNASPSMFDRKRDLIAALAAGPAHRPAAPARAPSRRCRCAGCR